jgi:hypothetical protein
MSIVLGAGTARLTREGRHAFELHVAALQEIVARSGAGHGIR